jgi:hypothetical protein
VHGLADVGPLGDQLQQRHREVLGVRRREATHTHTHIGTTHVNILFGDTALEQL